MNSTSPIHISDLNALSHFASSLANELRPGDVIALEGDLGAGKTTLSKALIRSLTQDNHMDVPSPTFSLVQTYDAPNFTIWHFDLYRLENPEEVYELGIEDALDTGVCLIEWPQLAKAMLPSNTRWLEIQFGKAPNERYIDIKYNSK